MAAEPRALMGATTFAAASPASRMRGVSAAAGRRSGGAGREGRTLRVLDLEEHLRVVEVEVEARKVLGARRVLAVPQDRLDPAALVEERVAVL